MEDISINEQDVQDSLNFTEKIINECGPRLTGTENTKKAAEMIKEEMNSFCNYSTIDSFDVHPKAFLGWIKLLSFFYVISIGFFWIKLPIFAALFITLGIIVMIGQFFYYKEWIDPFWKMKTGYNVYGTIEPSGEVKQQLVISGHHDSSYVFNFLYHLPKLYPIRIFGSFGSIIFVFICSWAWVAFELITGSILSFTLIRDLQIASSILLIFIFQIWFYRGRKGTPGAGDNMISSAVAIQLGKKIAQLKKLGKGPEHTRIFIASWDGEEAGLRGARDFCKNTRDLLQKYPGYNLNMDCLYYVKDISFLTSDINGTVKLSKNMAKVCSNIAEDLGYKSKIMPVSFLSGGTDAAEFAKIGIQATSLMGMPWGNTKRSPAYHTPNDTIDKIEPAMVEASLKIVSKFIQQLEKSI